MTAKQRQNLLAILAIGGLGLLAADRFLLSPLTRSWQARSARIQQLERDLNQGHLLLQRDQAIRLRWATMQTNALPAEVSAAESMVLRAFDTWSKDSQISVSSIKQQWREHDDYLTLQCRADAYGTMQALTRFLYELEQDPLALKIEDMEITSRDNEGQTLALALEVSGLQLRLGQPGNP